MSKKQSKPTSKISPVISTSIRSSYIKNHSKHMRRKSSIEDLAEEGFKIGRRLGEGSYSKVRAATFRGQDIAVKIITRSELSFDFESKFLPRELNILASVRHPNIIHVYKIFRYPKRIYIFMELIERGDLLKYIRGRGRLMEAEAHLYFKQMVSALRYLHSLNIAHRDLKCENVMLNDNDEIKLIDFGFCRYAVDEDNRRVLSSTFCGSTAYAAPEVLKGIPYNPMMYDVWSLGCILYIMVTGTMPFDDSNVVTMVKCQLKRQFKYPSTFTVTKPVKTLISCMLEPDVTRRVNMNQISQCSWLKQTSTSFRPKSSRTKGVLPDVYSSKIRSTSTQTHSVCIYGELHFSDECDCVSSLDNLK